MHTISYARAASSIMSKLEITSDPAVEAVFQAYPRGVKKQMRALRRLVLTTAQKTPEILNLEETLKWGEPAYLTPHGSTLRMDWKPKAPDQVALYFKCTSKLVPTFRTVFDKHFVFEGNRAIILPVRAVLPAAELAQSIRAALRYHSVKHLPDLGLRR
ncbi:MAG: DUF1801 domain-containing protein [Leptospiraceae bacterium]|nr:DUF1801 domain-containing protein [Leptospiraceae bacterium]